MSTQVLHPESAHQEAAARSGGDRHLKAGVPSAESSVLGGLAAQTAERRAKRDALQARGINPYPTRFERSVTLAGLQAAYAGLAPDTRTGEVARVAGRVTSMRGHGRLRFVTVEDVGGSVQLMFQADHLPADASTMFVFALP